MTSDARASELIRAYFRQGWPRVSDVDFDVSGPPEPRGESLVHLQVWSGLNRAQLGAGRAGWAFVRIWVPLWLQISLTTELHRAAREVLEGTIIPSDDGRIQIDEGERMEIGKERMWWMSVVSFPFRFLPGRSPV